MYFNPSTWEAEAGRFLSSRPTWSTEWVPGQPGVIDKPCLENKTKQNKTEWRASEMAQHCPPGFMPPVWFPRSHMVRRENHSCSLPLTSTSTQQHVFMHAWVLIHMHITERHTEYVNVIETLIRIKTVKDLKTSIPTISVTWSVRHHIACLLSPLTTPVCTAWGRNSFVSLCQCKATFQGRPHTDEQVVVGPEITLRLFPSRPHTDDVLQVVVGPKITLKVSLPKEGKQTLRTYWDCS